MKNLTQFLNFDLTRFLDGKALTVTAVAPWVDFNTKQTLGTKVEAAITKDDTTYAAGKDGAVVSNLFEKVTIKLAKDIAAVTVPVGAVVEIVNGVGSVYGDFRNKLSIKADDVKVIPASAQHGGNKS